MIFEKIHQKNLTNQIEKALLLRDVSQRNGKVKSVAFLYDGTLVNSVSEMKKITDVLNISQERITFLSFVTFDKNNPSLTREEFSRKDFSWKGKLKRQDLIDFVKTPFDVLVCFQDGSHNMLEVIASKSMAKFKIGLSGSDQRIHDLIVNRRTEDSDEIALEVKKYLTVLGKL